MGALPSTKLQINFSTPSRTLINIYADDETELAQLLSGLSDHVRLITETEQLFGAVSTVALQLGGQVSQAAPGPEQGSAGLPPGTEPMFCQHGEMTYKTGVSRAGNNYAVFECSQKVCDSKWPPRKRN